MRIHPNSCRSLIACLLLLAVFFCHSTLSAQTPASSDIKTSASGISSDGCDFYLGYIEPSYNRVLNGAYLAFFQSYAVVSAYTDCKVSVLYFDDAGVETLVKIYSLSAHSGIQIALDLSKMTMDDPGDLAQYRACHIISDHPVNIQYYSIGADGSGSYLALSTSSLGKRYVVASYNDNPGLGAVQSGLATIDSSAGLFLIIGAFNNTSVKITPNATTKGGHPGAHSGAHPTGVETPYTITLNRGQCYLVKSGSTESDVDISGSLVESTKPVAVLGGQENATLGVTAMATEARDFMVEQMLPIDYLDTTGYVSIPLKDSQPADPANEGAGENYRVYAFDPAGSKAVINIADIGSRDMTCGRMAYPAPEQFGVTQPVELHSTNGKNFSVMMYDQRNQQSQAPFPAPSMMTIVPISRWATSYSWYVPQYSTINDAINLHQYFMNIIAPTADLDKGITISVNGGDLKPLKQVFSSEQSFRNIPGHPELIGTRISVHPGNYYATSPRPFMIYNYSYHGMGEDKDNPPDADEWFSSTSNPTGALLWSGDSGLIHTTSDGFRCTEWNVCISDDRKTDPGIRSIALLNDPHGVQFSPGRQSYNCHLDPLLDPSGIGHVQLDGTSATACFKVVIDNILIPAYAAVLITDNAGNERVIDLRYDQPKLSVTPAGAANSFRNIGLGTDTCFTIVLKNLDTAFQSINAVTLDTAGGFRLSSVSPAVPLQLKPGNSLTMNICFTPHDTVSVAPSLNVIFDCLTLPIGLSGNGATGLITATDQNFGKIDTGQHVDRTVSVKNIGSKQFTLTKNWTISGSKAFSVHAPPLPVTLLPAAAQTIDIEYAPKTVGKDSAIIQWTSDIPNPYSQSVKSYSVLTGEGLAVISGVGEVAPASALSIHPNPAGGRSITLLLSNAEGEIALISIFDLLGREMYQKQIQLQGSNSEVEIPVSDMPNGLYYARIEVGGKTLTEKFEVRR